MNFVPFYPQSYIIRTRCQSVTMRRGVVLCDEHPLLGQFPAKRIFHAKMQSLGNRFHLGYLLPKGFLICNRQNVAWLYPFVMPTPAILTNLHRDDLKVILKSECLIINTLLLPKE